MFTEKFDGTSSNQLPDENKPDAKTKGDKQEKVKKKAKTGDIIIYNKFGEEVIVSRPVFEGLMKKVEKSGIDIETLGEVYSRGRDAWQDNGKLTQEQYAFARVNSYINEGSAYYELDADLHGEELVEKRGLWDNIHAKRKRIKAGSGERMRKPGSKGAPTAQDFRDAQESVEIDEAEMSLYDKIQAKRAEIRKNPEPEKEPPYKRKPALTAHDRDRRRLDREDDEAQAQIHKRLRKEDVELDEGTIHSVHVRTYDSKGEKTLNSKDFANHVKAHGGELHYGSDKGVAFKFKHAHQAENFHRGIMSKFRDLGSENDGEMHEDFQIDEMDKTQGSRRSFDSFRGQDKTAKAIPVKNASNDALKTLNKSFNKEETVLESDCGCDSTGAGATDNAEIAPGTKKRRKEGTVVSRPDTKPSKMGKQKELKDKVLDEEGNSESNPAKREVGTDSLVKAFKKDTPGQDPVLNESFNIAYSAGVGVTLTAADLGMKVKSGFELHPSVIEELKKLDSEEESE